jgi:hypothetical protein
MEQAAEEYSLRILNQADFSLREESSCLSACCLSHRVLVEAVEAGLRFIAQTIGGMLYCLGGSQTPPVTDNGLSGDAQLPPHFLGHSQAGWSRITNVDCRPEARRYIPCEVPAERPALHE